MGLCELIISYFNLHKIEPNKKIEKLKRFGFQN